MCSIALPAPTDVRIHLRPEPLSLRREPLTFSWKITASAGEQHIRQCAYRIVVAEGVDNVHRGPYMADTGWVASAESTSVAWDGLLPRLIAGRLYYARVAIEDNAGRRSVLSAPLPFTLDTEWVDRTAVWSEEPTDFLLCRHAFHLDAHILSQMDRTLVSVTATSPEPTRQYVYDLFCNGTELGVGPSRYTTTAEGEPILLYQTYDITAQLHEGENVLSSVLYATAEHGFLCQVTVYNRAGQAYILTNSGRDAANWNLLPADGIFGKSNSIGTGYFIAHACNINANAYPFGFDAPGFDTAGWSPAVPGGPIGGGRRLVPSEVPGPRHFDAPDAGSHPPTVTPLSSGGQLVDLGAEIIGGFCLTVDVPEEMTITLVYGEQLAGGELLPSPEAHVKCPMNTGNCYTETWNLRPGRQTLESFSMMAYRYVEITGLPILLTPDAARGRALRQEFDATAGSLETDHPLLADIHRLVKHTIEVTTQDLYVDSQSRERRAYEGDLLINLLASYAMEDRFTPARLTAEYLLGHRTWPADYLLTIILAVYADYMATGDNRILRAWYPRLAADLFTNYRSDCGLIRSPMTGMSTTNAVLVDWPPSERDGYDMNVTYNTAFNALQLRAYRDMAAIARVLEKPADTEQYTRLADNLMAAIIHHLYDPATGRYRDGLNEDGTPSPHASQHATAYALFAGAYTDQDMADRLAVSLLADGRIRMSVYGAFFLLDGLYASGHGKAANALLLDPDESDGARTWAAMIHRVGATVTTEAWCERNKPNMTLSHPWGAAPAYFLARGIAGITPTAPTYASFDVCPSIAGIANLCLTVPTVRGPITVAWRTGKAVTLSVSVPPNTEATVHLPDGPRTVGSGEWTWELP